MGVPEIDAQHEEICRIINDLFAAVKTRKRREGFFLEVMGRLQMYIRQHFSAEESLFLNSAYSEHQSHITQHREFERRIETFSQQYCTQVFDESGLLRFLVEWFITHTQQVDRGYVRYLQ